MLAGAGLTMTRPRWARWTLLVLILAFTVPALADHYAQRIHPMVHHRIGARYKVDNRAAARYIRDHWKAGDAVAHASTVTLGPFLYHYLRAPQAFAGFGQQEWMGHIASFPDEELWKSLGFQPQRVEEFFGSAQRVWLVTAWWEPKEHFPHATALRAWFDQQGVRIDYRYFDGIHLYLFDLSPGRRERATIDWVADLGWYETPEVTFPEKNETIEPGLDPEARMPAMAAQDPAALDIWFDAAYAAPAAAGSGDSPGLLALPVHLRNRSLETRPIELRVREAAAVYAALSFDREPDSQVWRPARTHLGKVAYHAGLDGPEAAGSLRRLPGLRGEYEVYVEMFRDSGEVNETRGALRVDVLDAGGNTRRVSTLEGYDPRAATGWHWLHAGRVRLAADSMLVLTAFNPDGLPQAAVDIDHVALVPASHGEPAAWSGIALVEGVLEGKQEITIPVRIPGNALASGANVLLFEVLDAEYNVYRSLVRHVDTP